MAQSLSRTLIETVRGGFHRLGVDIHRLQEKKTAEAADVATALIALRDASGPEFDFLRFCASRLDRSHSQLLQDLWVLWRTGEKRDGYFVEFGATNGVTLSNTCLLERDYGWSGIVAEPARCWHADLRSNRKCSISELCVWQRSGEMVEFNETAVGELSTIESYSAADAHAQQRAHGRRYPVRTISLADLLDVHGAPAEIDYLSIDTEGSELAILSAFDFSRHRFRCISVEHNFMAGREPVHQLLTAAGYVRVFDSLSRWDDWYVHAQRD